MSEKFKKVMANSFLMAVLCIILGIVLLTKPEVSTSVLCDILAVILLVMGIVKIFTYLRGRKKGEESKDLALGLFAIVLAVLLFILPDKVSEVIPYALAVVLLYGGAEKIQDSLELKGNSMKYWWVPLAMGAAVLVLGVLVFVNPFSTVKGFMRFIGIALIVEGAAYLVTALMAKDTDNKDKKNKEEKDLKVTDTQMDTAAAKADEPEEEF